MQEFNIESILESGNVIIEFQPILSIKKRKTVGFEALARGVVPGSRKVINPDTLFQHASRKGVSLELDRICRQKAMERFAILYGKDPELMLFMNLDCAMIEQGGAGFGGVIKAAESFGINPANIVIEITEFKVKNTRALDDLISAYKSYGFLIALDDFGKGHSNMERIALLKPDVIKIDRGLITGIDRIYHKQEVFRSLAGLVKNIGSVMLAEGVETEEQRAFLAGEACEEMQGYLVGRPEDTLTPAVAVEHLWRSAAGPDSRTGSCR